MSSPPTPTTSLKAAPLRPAPNKHRRISLHSIAALNPLRKKASPKASRVSSPSEPYEVAPGIWNTDATAKVFGYLEPAKGKGESRSKGVDWTTRNISQIPERKSIPQNVPRIYDIKNQDQTQWDCVELPSQAANGLLKRSQETETNAWNPVGTRKMRTVSRDDQLVQRGANPRTGLISPFAISDSSDDNLPRDYVNTGRMAVESHSSSKGKKQGEKWRQKGAGWALVESPLLSPIPQSIIEPLSPRLSVQQLEDKLLVEMPGVDNPEPQNLSDEQIKQFQVDIGRAYQHGGGTAMIDPDTLPSPRASTPAGPSTPPNKLHRIRRKMVGSDSKRRTTLDEMTSSAPTSKERINEPSGQSIEISPYAGKRFSSKPSLESGNDIGNDTFLGQRNEPILESSTSGKSTQSTIQRAARSKSPNESIHRFKPDLVSLQACPNLAQHLPCLNLPQPSNFANLETSSYRRRTQLLPERLRPAARQKRIIEDACTTTIISTLHQNQMNGDKPRTRRQAEGTIVPPMTTLPYLRFEIPKENYLRVGTVKKKPSSVIKHMADTSNSSTTRQNGTQLPGSVLLEQGVAEVRHKVPASLKSYKHHTRTPHHFAELSTKVAMTDRLRSQALHHNLLKKRPSLTSVKQSTSPVIANITRGQISGDPSNGAGITHTSGLLGSSHGIYGCNTCTIEPRASNQQSRRRPNASVETAWSPKRGVEFVDRPAGKLRHMPTGATTPKPSLIGSTAEAKRISAILCCGKGCIHGMTCHILRTLHPHSPALVAMKASEVHTRDYLLAVREVVLAVLYLLILSIILLALRKLLLSISMVLFYVWHPVRMMIAVVKLCILA